MMKPEKRFISITLLFILLLCLSGCRPAAEGNAEPLSGGNQTVTEAQNEQNPPADEPSDTNSQMPADEPSQTPSADSEGTNNSAESSSDGAENKYSYEAALARYQELKTQYPNTLDLTNYCDEHDIKIFVDIDPSSDFELGWVTVSLLKSVSEPFKAPPDFSAVNPVSVRDSDDAEWSDRNYVINNWTEDSRQVFRIQIAGQTKQDVIDAVRELEKYEYVWCAQPNYYLYPCD